MAVKSCSEFSIGTEGSISADMLLLRTIPWEITKNQYNAQS
jgi:hypothetical protein